MNATLPDVFDLSSLSRALDEDIAAHEQAAIDYVPMDVDDEWTPPPVLLMDNAPRPWYNPEPQPAWNNLDLELEDPPVENASQDVPGWYVNLREQNDQPHPIWRNFLPVVSVRKVENARVWEAPTPTPVPAPRPWYNPEPQPAWNNLELELEKPPVENASQAQNQNVPGSYVNLHGQKNQLHSTGRYLPVVSVRRIEHARVRKVPAPAPIVPVVLDRNEQKARAPAVPSLATETEKAHVFGVPGSARVEKVHARVAPTPARREGKARVPGISVSTRKAENACALSVFASVRKPCALDIPSARKAEKSRAPFSPTPSPRPPVLSKSISTRSKPVVPPRIDFANMSSSSKVKLEGMPKVDEHAAPMCISWSTSTLAHSIRPGSSKATSSYRRESSPITCAYQTPADEDVGMIEDDYIDFEPTISVPTTEDEDAISDDTHVAHLTESLQPVVNHAEDREPTVDCNAIPEGEVGASGANEEASVSADEDGEDKSGEDKSEEAEEETEEERQARIARLMTEVFGDGEDSDDEEPPSVKDAAVSLSHPSTSATSDALTADATESITDWSLDTPDDAGTEGNECIVAADRDEEDEESQSDYRAQLLADIFGDDEEDGQIVQEASLVPVPVPAASDPRKRECEGDGSSPMPCLATKDPRKRKREDDGPSPMPCLVATDPSKRKRHEGDGPSPMPCLVTVDPRKRKREDNGASLMPCMDPRKRKREDDGLLSMPGIVTMDPRKRKREDDGRWMPCLVTTDPWKRMREDDGPSSMSCLVTTDPRKRKREDYGSTPMPSLVTIDPRKRTREAPTPTLITRDPRKRRREDELRAAPSLVTRDPRKRLKG